MLFGEWEFVPHEPPELGEERKSLLQNLKNFV
jgi:hypothetical protein